MISAAQAAALITLTREEARALSKLETVVDALLHTRFEGAPLRLDFAEAISTRVAYALQRKFETGGGWRVTVEQKPEACVFSFVPMFFAAPTAAAPPVSPLEADRQLPPVKYTASAEARALRLLVRMPTRGRPVQALKVLEQYRELAGVPVTLEVVIDDDDPEMMAAPVLQRLHALGCVITIGPHAGKIDAVNGGRFRDWDVLLLASDDMVPVANGYGARILSAMVEHWPFLDGALHFDDGHQGPDLCTLPIFGKRLYEQFGYVHEPCYESLFCDKEQTELLRAMGRIVYIDELLIEHRHAAYLKAPRDALYDRNDKFWAADQAVYEHRKNLKQDHAQWAFYSPPMWLSILIATIPSRRAQLGRLVDYLYEQIEEWPLQVEIVVDGKDGNIGEKRQRLLERAKGNFVAFVDDDDLVAHDYVRRIVNEIVARPDADCLTIHGVMTTAGGTSEKFFNSAGCSSPAGHRAGDTYYRPANHLNPIRREIALRVGFNSLSRGEDADFAVRVRDHIRRETAVGLSDHGSAFPYDGPLYYYFYNPQK